MTKPLIHFTKMHGLGNDFVIINTLTKTHDLQTSLLANLSNRHTGIGFDQLLLIEPSQQADFYCRIFNADGSEAVQCGNGLRCIARYVHEEGLKSDKQFRIETKAGIFSVEIKDYDHIRVCMGQPQLTSSLIDLKLDNLQSLPVSILSLGNLHAITRVESIDSNSLNELASLISAHSSFPDGVNTGFMQVVNQHQIRLSTFERGAGQTYACGSNACAAAITGIVQGWLQTPVNVNLTYGSLTIEWEGEGKPVYMTGPATRVYSGDIT